MPGKGSLPRWQSRRGRLCPQQTLLPELFTHVPVAVQPRLQTALLSQAVLQKHPSQQAPCIEPQVHVGHLLQASVLVSKHGGRAV